MIRTLLAGLLCLATPALAEDASQGFRFGNDVFASGAAVTVEAPGTDDVFAAGERVDLSVPITGSAHLAGRRIVSDGAVAGDLYAFGADVTVSAPVAGDATLAGYDVEIGGAVGGDVRAAGRHLRIAAPVAGSALLSGASVVIDAAIEGDATIAADALRFGPEGRVGGKLVLRGRRAATETVPAAAVPADRVEREAPAAAPGQPARPHRPGWLALGVAFVVGTLVLAVLAALTVLIAPAGVERLGALAAARPFRTFWIGFLALAVLVGATVLAVLSIIGILAAPAILLAAALLMFIGYLVGVCFVGRAVWGWAGQLPPDGFLERVLTALIGAVAVSLVALVPFVGWILQPILALTGLGALTVALIRPEFRG